MDYSKDLMLGIVTLIKFDGTGIISKKRWTGRFHTRIKDGSPTVLLFLILPSFSQALASFMSKKYWGFSQPCCFASCFSPSFSDCTYFLSLLSIHLPTHLHLLKYSAQSLRPFTWLCQFFNLLYISINQMLTSLLVTVYMHFTGF